MAVQEGVGLLEGIIRGLVSAKELQIASDFTTDREEREAQRRREAEKSQIAAENRRTQTQLTMAGLENLLDPAFLSSLDPNESEARIAKGLSQAQAVLGALPASFSVENISDLATSAREQKEQSERDKLFAQLLPLAQAGQLTPKMQEQVLGLDSEADGEGVSNAEILIQTNQAASIERTQNDELQATLRGMTSPDEYRAAFGYDPSPEWVAAIERAQRSKWLAAEAASQAQALDRAIEMVAEGDIAPEQLEGVIGRALAPDEWNRVLAATPAGGLAYSPDEIKDAQAQAKTQLGSQTNAMGATVPWSFEEINQRARQLLMSQNPQKWQRHIQTGIPPMYDQGATEAEVAGLAQETDMSALQLFAQRLKTEPSHWLVDGIDTNAVQRALTDRILELSAFVGSEEKPDKKSAFGLPLSPETEKLLPSLAIGAPLSSDLLGVKRKQQ